MWPRVELWARNSCFSWRPPQGQGCNECLQNPLPGRDERRCEPTLEPGRGREPRLIILTSISVMITISEMSHQAAAPPPGLLQKAGVCSATRPLSPSWEDSLVLGTVPSLSYLCLRQLSKPLGLGIAAPTSQMGKLNPRKGSMWPWSTRIFIAPACACKHWQ